MKSLIAAKLRKILTMRTAIVALVVSVFLIALPLATVFAQTNPPASSSGVLSTIGAIGTKVATAVPLLILGAVVASYVNLLGLLALQMIHLLLKLAAFNDFINFAPVVQGWTIIRDVVNMSFVIILLIIAISTILNLEAYSYRRLLPRLVLMAVLINFSRTIAGLIIDAGQVVMLTFVNAFSGAAGGNFLNALRVNDLLSFGVGGIFSLDVNPGTILSSYILAAVAITVAFIVLLVIVGVLLFRILSLWFLIVLSPMAFALGAWPSGNASKYYGQWWDEFIKNILCPTILSFFLWLSLMMMGTDYVTVLAPGLNGAEGGKGPIPGSVTQLSAPETFASFLIGIGFLLMALKITQTMCGAVGGIGAKMLDYAKKQGISAAKLAGKGTLLGYGAAAGLGLRAAGLERAGREPLAKMPQVKEGGLSILAGLPIVRGWAQGKLGESRAARTKIFAAEGAKLTEMSGAEKDIIRTQAIPPILTPDTAAKRGGQLYNLLKDKQYYKYLTDTLAPGGTKEDKQKAADEVMASVLKEYNEVTKVSPTPEIARKAIDVKKERPDLLPVGDDFNDIVMNKMEESDVKNLMPSAFESVMKRPDMTGTTKAQWLDWALKGNAGLRTVAQKYATAELEEAKEKPAKLAELHQRRYAEFIKSKEEEKLRADNIGVDDVQNPLIVKTLAVDKDYSPYLEAILKSKERREAIQQTLQQERQKSFTENKAVVGTGAAATYTPEVQAISETALRAGANLNQTFNVDLNTANFKEVVDRNAYQSALRGINKVDVILKGSMDMLTKNNYNNELSEVVATSLGYDDMEAMVDAAKQPREWQNVGRVVEAMRQYSKRTNDPKVTEVLQAIDDGYIKRVLDKNIGGKEKGGGSQTVTVEPPQPTVTGRGVRGGRGGGRGGAGGGGTPPAVGSSVEEQIASVKGEVAKQVEAIRQRVQAAETHRLDLERQRDTEPREEKRRQIQDEIQRALEEERLAKEEQQKIKPSEDRSVEL